MSENLPAVNQAINIQNLPEPLESSKNNEIKNDGEIISNIDDYEIVNDDKGDDENTELKIISGSGMKGNLPEPLENSKRDEIKNVEDSIINSEEYDIVDENKADNNNNTGLELNTNKLSIKSEKEQKPFQIDNGNIISGLSQYSTYSNNKLVHDQHIKHISDTSKFEKDNYYSNKGGFNTFHKIYKKGEKEGEKVKTNTGVLKAREKNCNICKSNFNNAFIPALLSVCGEETIPNGIFKDEFEDKFYLQALNGNLADLYKANQKNNDVKLIYLPQK